MQLCERDESCGPCMCLQPEGTADPEVGQTAFFLSPGGDGDGSEADPWGQPDWSAIDAALATGSVHLYFQAGGAWEDPLRVERTDGSTNRLFLDGMAWGAAGERAIIPGIGTGYEGRVVSHVTVRGFDITGSDDKGVQWQAGDQIVIEDNLIHDNDGSPSVSLEYSGRSGHASTGFAVLRNHIWNQHGECIYIGGSDGQDAPSHQGVRIVENIVHDCWQSTSTQHDGINLKDRLDWVEVRRNVVFHTDWGIEAASAGLFESNLVFSTRRNGLHLTDEWGAGLGGAVLRDNVVLWAGHAGAYLNATNQRWQDLEIDGLTMIGSGQAGVEVGGEQGITGTMDRVLLVDNKVGLDAWDPVELSLGSCQVYGNDLDDDRSWSGATASCDHDDPDLGDLSIPAGPDLVFFTEDDPWRSPAGAAP